MRTDRRGQAAYEFAIGVAVFALAATALVEFAPVLLKNFELQSAARTDAGLAALGAVEGSDTVPGNSAAIASRAHPPVDVAAGADPWAYPVHALPGEPFFPDWRGNSIQPLRLIAGAAKKDYRFTLRFNGETLLDHERGHLAEEVHLPALGIPLLGGSR